MLFQEALSDTETQVWFFFFFFLYVLFVFSFKWIGSEKVTLFSWQEKEDCTKEIPATENVSYKK